MNAAMRLAAASTDVVKVGEGEGATWWRIRRVEATELGGGALLAMAAQVKHEADAAKGIQANDAIGRQTAESLARMTGLIESYVCEGVIAVSTDGETFEDIKIVAKLARAAPGSSVLHVSHLPPGAGPLLGGAIMALSNDSEAHGRRLATFHGG